MLPDFCLELTAVILVVNWLVDPAMHYAYFGHLALLPTAIAFVVPYGRVLVQVQVQIQVQGAQLSRLIIARQNCFVCVSF